MISIVTATYLLFFIVVFSHSKIIKTGRSSK